MKNSRIQENRKESAKRTLIYSLSFRTDESIQEVKYSWDEDSRVLSQR